VYLEFEVLGKIALATAAKASLNWSSSMLLFQRSISQGGRGKVDWWMVQSTEGSSVSCTFSCLTGFRVVVAMVATEPRFPSQWEYRFASNIRNETKGYINFSARTPQAVVRPVKPFYVSLNLIAWIKRQIIWRKGGSELRKDRKPRAGCLFRGRVQRRNSSQSL
jgi:hypothetical protein